MTLTAESFGEPAPFASSVTLATSALYSLVKDMKALHLSQVERGSAYRLRAR